MANNTRNGKYIICPVCSGQGKNNLGLACPNCSGMGVGKFAYNRFFFWAPKLGRAMIELSHIRQKFQLAINIIAFTIALSGLLSLTFWLYNISRDTAELAGFAFWRIQHPLILIFWIGLAAGMFIFYRLSEEIRRQHLIRPLPYDEHIQAVHIADNWDELRTAKGKFKVDVSGGFSRSAMDTVEQAFLLANKLEQPHATPAHLFFACLSDRQVAAMFSRLDVDSARLIEAVKKRIGQFPRQAARTLLSRTIREVLVDAYISAYQLGQKKVTPKNFIIPCLAKDSILKEILYELEVDTGKIHNVLLWFIINERQVESYRRYRQMAGFKPSTNMDRAYTSVATPILNALGYDLTVAAKWNKLDFCVAREEEINRIWQQFESGLNGVLLVGPPGVGKKTIVDGIAQLMVKEQVPKFLQDKRLVELDAARLISGASPSEAQGRMLNVIDEVARAGNIVLFIDNIENLLGITSGGEESLDLSEVLSSALERRNLYCLASASDENYIKYIQGCSIAEAMAKVDVEEPEGNQAIQIIESKIGYFEGKYKVYFSYSAVEQVLSLAAKYIHDKYLPEKAVKILELVAVRAAKEKGENAFISREDIAAVISDETKIPVTKITENEGRELLHLEERIHERMIDQEEAVRMVSASLRRARTELREGKRPIANFLFLGPTGVGKTELAKTLSYVYFGKEEYMVRIDMSEYQHPDSVKKMIGDSDGAKGYLTEKVRQLPFTLVLLDEVEKAHPDIMNLFLQVMDDGRLTDGQGHTVDFTNTIIIATSNAGAIFIQEQIFAGKRTEEFKDRLLGDYLVKVMRPELINRFDGVIVFEPLSMEHVVEIAGLMLKGIAKLLEPKGIGFRAEEGGIRVLAKAGFDPKFGARPLRRLLQDRVEDQIANQILLGNLKRRDTVVIDEQGNVRIEKGKKIL